MRTWATCLGAAHRLHPCWWPPPTEMERGGEIGQRQVEKLAGEGEGTENNVQNGIVAMVFAVVTVFWPS